MGGLTTAERPKSGRIGLRAGFGGHTFAVWGFSPTRTRVSHYQTQEVRKVRGPGTPGLGGDDLLSAGVPFDWVRCCPYCQSPEVRKSGSPRGPRFGTSRFRCSLTAKLRSEAVAGAQYRTSEVRKHRSSVHSDPGGYERSRSGVSCRYRVEPPVRRNFRSPENTDPKSL